MIRTAGFRSRKRVKSLLQAFLFYNRKDRERRAVAYQQPALLAMQSGFVIRMANGSLLRLGRK